MKSIQSFFLSVLSIQALTAGPNPVFYAVTQKNTLALQNILKTQNHNSTLNAEQQTILHIAVLAKNWKAVKSILKSEFTNINQLDKYDKTAMDYAVEYGYNKIVRKLYKNDGKVTSVENAKNAKKAIVRPFKIAFFFGPIFGLFITFAIYALAIAVNITLFILCFPILLIAASGGERITPMFFFSRSYCLTIAGLTGAAAGGLFMIIGGAGWARRSKQNLLLTKPYNIA